MRKRYIQDPETLELVPADDYVFASPSAPMVIPDIQPYKSMATGEMITSRSRHREHLRANGLVEVGNETKYITQHKKQEIPKGLRESIARQVYDRLK